MKQLTLEELMALERLTGREYCRNGQPRKRPRRLKEYRKLNIPIEHRQHMMSINPDIKNRISLDRILQKEYDDTPLSPALQNLLSRIKK